MDKSISLNEIRSRCAEFAVTWMDADGSERQEDQSFVRDLLSAFGISETKAALYQKRVQRSSTGNQGYIDALIPGLLLIEMKSAGKPLALAEAQALDYIQHLPEAEAPRYVLTSDFKKFRLLDILAPKGEDVTEFLLDQLPNRAEDLAFLAGYKRTNFGDIDQEQASIKAANLMARLFEALEGSGYSEHESSIFLVRTLFLLFADDSGVWPRGTFVDFLRNRTQNDGSDLGAQMAALFQVLNQPEDKRPGTLDESLSKFPYVNGGIFAEPISIASFDPRMHRQLLEACAFDWSPISPAIFGSLFQAVKSPEARRELGEHYTTEKNILKTIRPLFLDHLMSTFERYRSDVSGLKRLRERLGQIRVFDPACGCGNFLVVSYRELRSMELNILLRLAELGDKSALPTLFFEREHLAVQLENIYGIELEEWPARIAQTALLLAEHQANQAMSNALGKAPSVLPLERFEGIRIGNALREDWNSITPATELTYVVGNPPFVGKKEKAQSQKQDLQLAWGDDYDGTFDYVTGWYRKAADYFKDLGKGNFAFVSTNSITQGQPVAALFEPLFRDGWRVGFAHRTFVWTSEAPGQANVHCVIIGFEKGGNRAPRLFIYPDIKDDPVEVTATHINPYLMDQIDIFVRQRNRPLNSQLPLVDSGSIAVDWGFLTLDDSTLPDLTLALAEDPIARKYLTKYVGGEELINSVDRYCLWLKDASPADIAASPVLRAQVREVKKRREASNRPGTKKQAATPHLFGEDRQPKTNYLAIPQTFSENRLFATASHLPSNVIANAKLRTSEDPDGFAFAIISSSMFITWQKAIGGRLKSDPSFSNTLVWNNLPLPAVSDELRVQIAEAGKLVLSAREKFQGRSLAEMYNPLAMDPELVRAHANLDRIVDRAFGAEKTINSIAERENILFTNFRKLVASEQKSE